MRVDKYIDGANEQRKYIDGDDGNMDIPCIPLLSPADAVVKHESNSTM